MQENEEIKKQSNRYPLIGLILNIVFLIACCLVPEILILAFLMVPPLGLVILILPFLGITFGIYGIGEFQKAKKEERRNSALVLGILDIVIPIVFVTVAIILFSTGALVIRFM